MGRLAALAALTLVVAGCGTATLYQPLGLEGGYAQTRLGSDMFNVIFQGNAFTPWRTAEDYALYRSAELSVDSGFDYFVVVGGNADVSTRLLAARDAPPAPPPADVDTDHPMVSLIVRGFSGERPSPQAFNAREVIRDLGPTIKRRGTGPRL